MFNKVVSIAAKNGMPKRTLGALAMAMALTGCVSANAGSDGRYTAPIGNAPVITNETPYSNALRCLARHVPASTTATRIAVGNIRDYTGKAEADGTGMKLTQGASLMAMSALGKAGVPLVERYDNATMQDLEEATGVGRRKLRFHIGQLVRHEYLERHGMGRGTYYTVVR